MFKCRLIYKILLISESNPGKVRQGLHCDPSGQYLVYAIGTNIIKSDTRTGIQTFMIGHGNNVTCIDFEKCGRYIASGQMNYIINTFEIIRVIYKWKETKD